MPTISPCISICRLRQRKWVPAEKMPRPVLHRHIARMGRGGGGQLCAEGHGRDTACGAQRVERIQNAVRDLRLVRGFDLIDLRQGLPIRAKPRFRLRCASRERQNRKQNDSDARHRTYPFVTVPSHTVLRPRGQTQLCVIGADDGGLICTCNRSTIIRAKLCVLRPVFDARLIRG